MIEKYAVDESLYKIGREVAIDIETYDPDMEVQGNSVYFNTGYILGFSLYIPEIDTGAYLNLGHPDSTEEERSENTKYIKWLLSQSCSKVGANIQYDIDWLQHWKGNITSFKHEGILQKVEGTWLDVQIAEPMLDEYADTYKLDYLAQKYLKVGKYKNEIDDFCEQQGLKGDSRKHLWLMPSTLVGKYAIEDSRLAYLVWKKQEIELEKQNLMAAFNIECRLSKAVLKMRATGAHVDTVQFGYSLMEALEIRDEAKREADTVFGAINLASPKQLAIAFDRIGQPYNHKLVYLLEQGYKKEVVIPKYQAETILKCLVRGYNNITEGEQALVNRLTGNRPDRIKSCNPTIDAKYLDSLAEHMEDDEDENTNNKNALKALLTVKKANKIVSTYLDGAFKKNRAPDGKLHPNIWQLKSDSNNFGHGQNGTVTGRLAMSKPNLQNIPSRGKPWKYLCRSVLVPNKNCWWAKIDYSQIEYRVLAHYAYKILHGKFGSQQLVDSFRNDPLADYHQLIMDITGLERPFAKNFNFGSMYGMGVQTMAKNFGWDLELCEEANKLYHMKAPYVKQVMNAVMNKGERVGYVVTIAERKARLRNPDKSYVLMNQLIQGTAADVMKKAMVQVYESEILDVIDLHITVHDELDSSVPKNPDGIKAIFQMQDIMESVYTLEVPIRAELEMGKNWADLNLLDFATMNCSEEQHAKFLPYIPEGDAKVWNNVNIQRQDWVNSLTTGNTAKETEHLMTMVGAMETARKEYRKHELL